jgi:hypothetical protein
VLGEVFVNNSSFSTQPAVLQKSAIYLRLLLYNMDATIFGPLFVPGKMSVMYCIHDQKPSLFYRFMNHLDEYIVVRHMDDADFPSTKSDLEASLECKFVLTNGECLDEGRYFIFSSWCIAIYMTSDVKTVKEVVLFIDAFVHWAATASERTKDEFDAVPNIELQCPLGFNMELIPSSGDEDGEEGVMKCPFTITNSEDLKMKVTNIPPPCFLPCMLVATIEATSKNTVAIVWSGNTKPFREAFEARGIGGKAVKKNENDKFGEYFRKCENLSIREEADRERVLQLFGEEFTKNTPVVVKVRTPPSEDDAFQDFLNSVKKLSHCVFA